MSYTPPTLSELIAESEADIESRLPGSDAKVRRTNLNVLARVNAGGRKGIYGYLAWLFKQLLPSTADEDVLQLHAAIWLKVPRVNSEYATGHALTTGANGTVIEAGTIYQRSDGAQYEVSAEVTVVAGSAVMALTALEAGQAGSAPNGTALTIVNPIPNLSAIATVDVDGLTGGADVEEVEAQRTRLGERLKNPPQGGSNSDYVAWAKEVAGVTRAWVYPKELGRGTVTVRFVRDNDASLIPDAAEVADVQDYIDGLRPPGGEFYAVAPIPDPVLYAIHLNPDTPAIRAAVEAELRDLHSRECIPGGNYFDPETRTMKTGGLLLVSHIREAVSLAAGENDHTLIAPVANVTAATGHISTFGSVAWS